MLLTLLKTFPDLSSQFYKYQGTGNDFILFEDYEGSFPTGSLLISRICNRNLGIGADGLLLLQKSEIADTKMRIFNQDGTEATMCGNGLRCVIRHLGKSCTIETKGGISLCEHGTPLIKVTLPKNEIVQSQIALPNNLSGHLINTGTPHLVIFTEDINNQGIAPELRYHPMFEKGGVNVNLAQIVPGGIRVRTFEKGVETETLSCGSGGAAVALIHNHVHNQIDKQDVRILFTSYELTFSFDTKDRIWMEGPAEFIFQGNLCLNNL